MQKQSSVLQANQKINFFRSIQGRLIVWFLVLSILPMMLISIFAYTLAQDALRRSSHDKLAAVLETKSARLTDWLSDTERIAQTMAALPSIADDEDETTHMGIPEISEHYHNVYGHHDHQGLAVDDPGQPVQAHTHENPAQQPAEDEAEDPPADTHTALDDEQIFQTAYHNTRTVVESFIAHYRRVDAVMLIDVNGDVVLSTFDPVVEHTHVSLYPTIPFEDALKDTITTDVQISVDGVTPIFVVATPVIDPISQDTVGVLVVRVNLRTIDHMLGLRIGLGDSGETYLVHGETRQMMNQSRFITDESTILNPKYTIDTYGVQQALGEQPRGVGQYADYRDIDVLGTWQYIEGRNWVLVAEIDTVEAYAAIDKLAGVVSLLVLIALGVVAAIAFGIARNIARPIQSVAGVAVQIASGDLDQRTTVHSRNEVGMLAGAFNFMADNLQEMLQSEQQRRNRLEQIIAEYTMFVEKVAQGDLTARLQAAGDAEQQENKDLISLGMHLNSMVEGLREITQQTYNVSSGVVAAANEILAATTQQLVSSTEQDASVTQTMTTVTEVQSTVAQTAERAETVAIAAQQSVDISRQGLHSVIESIAGMEMIRERVEDIAHNILALSEQTQQIGAIISTVNDIADQSKLLALNASIEAARAGEEGRGFAVVAMEVRTLAEQSRQATEQIGAILNDIQQATNASVMATEEGSKGVDSGLEQVNAAGTVIEELAQVIHNSAQAAGQIAASTRQQTTGMDQLAAAMDAIQQATVQAQASSQQSEQSAQALTNMAQDMQESISRYNL